MSLKLITEFNNHNHNKNKKKKDEQNNETNTFCTPFTNTRLKIVTANLLSTFIDLFDKKN